MDLQDLLLCAKTMKSPNICILHIVWSSTSSFQHLVEVSPTPLKTTSKAVGCFKLVIPEQRTFILSISNWSEFCELFPWKFQRIEETTLPSHHKNKILAFPSSFSSPPTQSIHLSAHVCTHLSDSLQNIPSEGGRWCHVDDEGGKKDWFWSSINNCTWKPHVVSLCQGARTVLQSKTHDSIFSQQTLIVLHGNKFC